MNKIYRNKFGRNVLALAVLFSFLAVNTFGVSAAPARVPLKNATASAATYDDTDAGWTYAGGSWLTYSATGPFGGSEHYINTLNATASFNFNGSSFIYYYSSDFNRSSSVQISVDGVALTTISENGAHLYQQSYTSPILATTGAHTLQIKNTGSGYFTVDALTISTVHDDTDAGWTMANGTWTTYSATGPFGGSEQYSYTVNSTASFNFTGYGFVLYFSADSNRSTSVQVTVDSVVAASFSENMGGHAYQSTYTSPIFTAGSHTLQFKNVSGGVMTIDAILVLGASSVVDTTPPGAPTSMTAVTDPSTNDAVDLGWTAPANDAGVPASGAVASYLVRYSASPITLGDETAWNAATPESSGLPTPPKAPGQTETMIPTDLQHGHTYYFAARAIDPSGNIGRTRAAQLW